MAILQITYSVLGGMVIILGGIFLRFLIRQNKVKNKKLNNIIDIISKSKKEYRLFELETKKIFLLMLFNFLTAILNFIILSQFLSIDFSAEQTKIYLIIFDYVVPFLLIAIFIFNMINVFKFFSKLNNNIYALKSGIIEEKTT